jgi:hypothetical protein
MSSPERLDENLLTVLLDPRTGLEDPIRVAAAVEELRRAAAPPALRTRVVELCERRMRTAPAHSRPRRRRRVAALLVAGTVAAAAGVAVVSLPGAAPTSNVADRLAPSGLPLDSATGTTPLPLTPRRAALSHAAVTLPTAPGRIQHYAADIALRVRDDARLSSATQQAIRTTRALGGYVVSVDLGTAQTGPGAATLDVRVPIAHVQAEVARLSQLGAITAQHVSISDLQVGYDRTARRIDSLRETLAVIAARLADPATSPEARVQLLARRLRARTTLAGVERAQRAIAHRGAYASVGLRLATRAATHAAPAGHRSRLGRAVADALGVVAIAAVGVLYGLIVLSPLLLLALAVWLGLRLNRRRVERRILEV